MTGVTLKPADIFLTRGRGLLSRLIRFFTRAIGESRTKINHVGVVVEGGGVDRSVVIEALSHVKRHRLWEQYGPPATDEVTVYRPRNLKLEEVNTVVAAATAYEGRTYGAWMLVAHFLDWALLGTFLFRRLVGSDNYPICSWLVAHAFKKIGLYFGVEPGAADPDDIWDFVISHPNEYELVLPLGPLRRELPH